VAAVLPYLVERGGRLSPRALRLLRAAAEHGSLVSVVAENPVEDVGRVREWLAARNRITVQMAAALIVPEARLKKRWGTRHAVEHALAAKRLVVVLEPRTGDSGTAAAFKYFRLRGATTARDVGEALDMVERLCRPLQRRL
jgi:predicted Rossmann fold nucleotide-binding protein DprA/Smf involved in DNA uptake